jgi:molybdate transport system ATP-binding protein
MIATTRPDGLSALNVLSGVVRALDASGDGLIDVGLDCGGVRLAARLTRKSIAMLKLEPGREVYAVIKSVALDRETLGRAPTPVEPTSTDASTSRA